MDTIFAPSTAPGRAGIAVLRVSGAGARSAVVALTGGEPPNPRQAVSRSFRAVDGNEIDRGLLLWFAAPASFTGDDLAEFHVHGGRAVTDAMLDALGRVPGLRAAEPGEFTRRAVENGKLDLTQAEALADLIDAETEAQRRQALNQYEGALSVLYEAWRSNLIRALALVEAVLDFPDEELPDSVMNDVRSDVAATSVEIREHLDDHRRGEILREGIYLTVFGIPNSGKSSLLNALAQRDVAIVSEMAGTTRDVIEVRLDLGGYPVIVADTAGLREGAGAIEAEGVRRALARAEQSDIRLLLVDATAHDPFTGLPPSVRTMADLVVWNKTDLAAAPPGVLGISAKTGAGLPSLLADITRRCEAILGSRLSSASLTRARHRQHLTETVVALSRAEEERSAEILAEDLRLALRSLGRITGRVDVEDVLDVIFREFCIGK